MAAGEIQNSNRTVFEAKEAACVLGFMPAASGEFLSAKVAAVTYGNAERQLDCHQGAVLLFDKVTGVLKAVIDGTETTAVRTAAMSAFATETLIERPKAITHVAIIGAGVQALHHTKMFYQCFGLKRFVLMSRSKERALHAMKGLPGDITIEHRGYGSSLEDCDLVVTATHAREIVLNRKQISRAPVIIALGACKPGAQEIANDILDGCVFVADSLVASRIGSGEGGYAVANSDRIAHVELSSIAAGRAPTPEGQLTVFKSVGLGFQDLVCAKLLYETLQKSPEVTEIKGFGGARAY